MPKKVYFKEVQRFKQWWIWLILIGLNTLFISLLTLKIFYGVDVGNKPASLVELIIIGAVTVPLSLFFLGLRLHSELRSDGIYLRFSPLHWKYRAFTWDKVERLYIREYKPLKEYGGWGLRFGLFGNGMAYNVAGNVGLQLVLKSGRRLLIGTQRGEELKQILKELGHYGDKHDLGQGQESESEQD